VADGNSARRAQECLAAARAAFPAWSSLPLAARVAALAALRRVIQQRSDEIVQTVCQDTGKVPTEALLGEIYPTLEILRYYEKEAPRLLRTRSVPTSPLAYPFASAYVEPRPFGTLAVISPWNFPFQLSLIPAATALLAGNTVCLKPSELCGSVAALVADLLQEVPAIGEALTVLEGDGAVGQALVAAGPDLVFFTGGGVTGRAVMALAAQNGTPVILELGGKDAMIVCADAPWERAVRAAVYGAFANSGQMCIAVERLYVQRQIYPRFLQEVVTATRALRVGTDSDSDLGRMTSPRQIEIVAAHYRDAVAKGAQVSGPLQREGGFVHPVVLWDVDHTMQVMREETFGPLLPVMPFDDEEEAIRLANDTPFGLNGSVWTTDLAKGRRLASRLAVGGCAVNDVIKNAGHPGLPFGGVRQSGFGRSHGAEGLLSFTQPVSVLVNTGRMPREPNWFPYSAQRYRDLRGFMDFVFGEGSLPRRFVRNWSALKSFREFFTFNLRQKLNKGG
jgi:acyl-CoA reductase-like NAD-dependent aldehyde dehydrogenase